MYLAHGDARRARRRSVPHPRAGRGVLGGHARGRRARGARRDGGSSKRRSRASAAPLAMRPVRRSVARVRGCHERAPRARARVDPRRIARRLPLRGRDGLRARRSEAARDARARPDRAAARSCADGRRRVASRRSRAMRSGPSPSTPPSTPTPTSSRCSSKARRPIPQSLAPKIEAMTAVLRALRGAVAAGPFR